MNFKCRSQVQLMFNVYFAEESLSVDPFKNSLKLFEHWEVLECLSHDHIKLYYLRDEFDCERNIQTVFHKMKRFKWAHMAIGAS